MEDNVEVALQIVLNGGDARSKALKAIRSAREGDLETAEKLMMESEEAILKAHQAQTSLIQAEARGEHISLSLLMVHAQDHIMNAMTVKDLANELIKEIEVRVKSTRS